MPKHFEKPKEVVLSRAILRNCLIQKMSGNIVYTDKTQKHRVSITSRQISKLTDPMDQRLFRRIDVRVSHVRIGMEDKWLLTMAQFADEPTYDTT